MRKVRITYLAWFGLVCASGFAQQKDTVRLDEITVTDYRSSITKNNFAETKIDSVTRSQFLTSSVAQLLLQQNTAFVKSYGPANIASLTLRGSTAQQVAVVWNGVNINNPMLGQTDVSLLPVGLFNSISLQKGALSGYWGSGAMAGILNLQSGAQGKGFTVRSGSSYSSFRNFVQWAAVDEVGDKKSFSVKLFGDLSANQYSYYTNYDSLKTAKQQHAHAKQIGLLEDWAYKISDHQTFGFHFWMQLADRQVPVTLQEIKQDALQKDQQFRSMLDWKLQKNKFSLTARAAQLQEHLIYVDTMLGINSNSEFVTRILDLEGQFYFPKGFTLTAGSSNSVSRATTLDYGGEKQITRSALYENLAWRNKMFSVSAYGRQEIFNGKTFVPTGGITGGAQVLKWMSCKVNAGTIYRYPTLNDLYWNPGGDPDLKPEKGFSEEGSLVIDHFTFRKFSVAFIGTLFNRNINNWIMWLPGKNAWTPQNVPSVWSRGGETNSEISYTGGKVKLSLNIITNYAVSTRTQTMSENDNSQGRQLPYVPMYSGSSVANLIFENFSLRSVYSYTGYRYLSSDNYNYLMPYQLFDLRLAYTLIVKKALFNMYVEGNNLFNENYFSMSQYPMPLRNFRVGFIFQFSKSNKKINKST